MRPTLTVRPATESDLPYLISLRLDTMSEHLRKAGVQLVADEQEARARVHLESCAIVLLDGQPAGMLKVVKRPDSWTIVQIQIAPRFQGQGLGTQLIAEALVEARQARVPVLLSVLKANPARELYERLGFTIVGEGELEYEMRAEVQPDGLA